MNVYVLGLTGGIGMGKSTTAKFFAQAGVPVWDADATVHKLYAKGGAAVAPMAKLAPGAVLEDAIDRRRLRDLISADPQLLSQIERIVHPLVAADRAEFLAAAQADIVVLDIPLLFEGGHDRLCDGITVVSAPPEVQKARVMSRGAMSEADFEMILGRQMPDAEKRRRADWVIETLTLDGAEAMVHQILADIRASLPHA